MAKDIHQHHHHRQALTSMKFELVAQFEYGKSNRKFSVSMNCARPDTRLVN